MNIDSLQAGRELDALVAEKVMGWKVVKGEQYVGKLDEYYAVMAGMDRDSMYEDILDAPNVGPGKTRVPKRVPGYSTDIAAAWEVLEKVAALRDRALQVGVYRVGAAYSVNMSGGKGWGGLPLNKQGNPWVTAETAPLAICRAALKACL